MLKLIKNGKIIDNEQIWIRDNDTAVSSNAIVPLARWLAEREVIGKVAGIWIDAGEGVEQLEGVDLAQFSVIGINFPAFTDGRGFSYARLLRERLNYQGEIRALGDFIPDQQGYLLRVGFNAFQFNDDVDLEKALLLNKSFSVGYQGDAIDPKPMFLRR
ncbi:hypothetical protein MSP8887_03221 [Marinomonas spartinae]|uniref:Oxidoreductase n=1 Tax=Marinomonas spartinae TaxID=1792290 RepID=A0A1A8TNU3_9GAMM|nr:DUF934 domain-containing protein [Marinomonas spartinae]SBS34669.1 hypothetical protein MSP8886_03134 [Marinomonas spartinae]SBS38226.1 hypothetical protein MSP8887_03221 [Marinomonas spartinae]